MPTIGTFPFGEPVLPVQKTDRSPKKVFVLGVYASAVHACWIGPDDRTAVRALAIRSEPTIFWRGEGVEELIAGIDVPEEAGRMVPAASQYNGPSGIALDERILAPVRIDRKDAWLCDLVPHSCVNTQQEAAVRRAYLPLVDKLRLPKWSVPPVPSVLADDARRQAIADELLESEADVLILLGDQPIRWFLKSYASDYRKLSDFGTTPETYGRLHEVTISGRGLRVLPIAHPRQVARLGRSSARWFELHEQWKTDTAPYLLR